MKKLKVIFAFIIVAALFVGILIFAMNENGGIAGDAAGPGTVRINEFMASNGGFLPDDTGSYSDWIEIHNPTDQPVSLSGLGLSDDKNSIKWFFPNVTLKPDGYAVVFASGTAKSADSLHTNFKLTAAGGGIYLTDTSGTIIDKIEYKDQVQNVSMGRTVENPSEWTLFDKPTPGFSNDEAGADAFEQSRYADGTTLIITEVMASNKITIADNKGGYSDYIEIYNMGDSSINLAGYGLSDDPAKLLAWRFPDVVIEPGEHLLVFASGEDVMATDLESGYIHTNFKVAAYEETVVLSTPLGLILDSVTVSESQSDMAYARITGADGYTDDWEETSRTTPGYPNTQEGYEQFLSANPIAFGPVIITEVMASNSEYVEESDGGTYDWIELFNQSNQTVNLAGYGLTDNPGNPAKWRFSDGTIEPGQYKVVLASGLDVKKNYIHTNFKLSASGDVLALFDTEGVLQDKYTIEPVPYGVSIGRIPGQQALCFFDNPTPGAQNASPSKGVVATPAVNIEGGSYSGPQQISFDCATEGASIHYTTDGTVPTESSPRYSSPVTVGKTGLVRARAFKSDYIGSVTQTSTYFIDESHSLPLISIVTDPKLLFDPTTGIYELGPNAREIEGSSGHYQNANYNERGQESERPASFEVFDESGQCVFEQHVAIRIQGGFSRDHAQKSFSIFARSRYGKSTMEHAFFEDRPFTEYKSLILRQGGQDQKLAKIREMVLLDLVEGKGLNVITQAYKPYVVYINGEYWGVYFMMEKRNKYFIAAHEQAPDEDNINVMKAYSILMQGSRDGYLNLMDYINKNDMSKKEHFDYVAARIDTDSVMDLMINQIYIANSDHANLQFYQVLPDGKWKQIYYDFCWSFGNTSGREEHPTLTQRMTSYTGSTLFTGLLSYKPWKDAFIERFAWTLKEIYNTERVIDYIDKWCDLIKDEMTAEREKFGGSYTNWETHVDRMREFARKRPAVIVRQLKDAFSLTSEQKQMLDEAIR